MERVRIAKQITIGLLREPEKSKKGGKNDIISILQQHKQSKMKSNLNQRN